MAQYNSKMVKNVRKVEEIVEYIYAQLDSGECEHHPVTVESIADEFGFTPRYLEKLFKEYLHVGLSPKGYIRLVQFCHAEKCHALAPQLSIKQLFPKLGLRSRATFEKLYKQFTKKPPKKHWRKLRMSRIPLSTLKK